MRVAYLDPHPVPGSSVEALQIAQNVDALAACGVDITLVTPQPREPMSWQTVLGRAPDARLRVEAMPDWRERWWAPNRSSHAFYWQAARWLKRAGVDLIWLRHLRLADALRKAVPHVKQVFETHELFAQSFRESERYRGWRSRVKLSMLAARERRVYAHARGLITLTKTLADDISATYSLTRPTLIAPDGFDAPLAQLARAVERPAHPVILYLGSLHVWKGVPRVVEAMRDVTGPAELWIVGGTPAEVEALRSIVSQHALEQRVRLVGAVPPAQRFDWIAAADITVLPLSETSIASRYTSPLKLFEYMALGKPVVAADLPALREVVTDGEEALLVSEHTPQAFARAINQLLNDASLRERLGNNARRRAQAFTWTRRAECIAAFFTDVAR